MTKYQNKIVEKKAEYPMKGDCQINNAIYKSDLTTPLSKKLYLGLAEGEWKIYFYKHKLSFKHNRYSSKATLSNCMWHLKIVSSDTLNLKWPVLRCVPPYHEGISKKCLLCLYEELEIVTHRNQKGTKDVLYKRSEFLC